jgi:hypothetical protein
MSHMVYRDHIAITRGDKSTTRSKVFYLIPFATVVSLSLSVSVAILRVASWQIRKYCDRSRQRAERGRCHNPQETAKPVTYLAAYSDLSSPMCYEPTSR